MIDFEAIYKENNSLWGCNEVLQKELLKEPERPVKPSLPKNHTSNGVALYHLDLQKYELLSAVYEEDLKRVKEHNKALHTQFEDFLKKHSGMSELTENQQKVVRSFYYDYFDNHYLGVVEEYDRKKDIINFIKQFNKA